METGCFGTKKEQIKNVHGNFTKIQKGKSEWIKKYILGEHSMCGFPVYPGGHEHTPRCNCDRHWALIPHRSMLQARTQVPWIHLSGSEHSSSERHPISSCRIGLQWPRASVIVSGGHLQTTARIGAVSNTVQVCCESQTSDLAHGFSQRLFTQVSDVGQLESLVHWGSLNWREHSTYGFPSSPGRQLHTGWWFLPSQRALSAHESTSHTFRHTRFNRSHASSSKQSSLYWQIPRTHDINGFPCVPAGQIQFAWWFCAKHSAPRPHWVPPYVHGLKHFSL